MNTWSKELEKLISERVKLEQSIGKKNSTEKSSYQRGFIDTLNKLTGQYACSPCAISNRLGLCDF